MTNHYNHNFDIWTKQNEVLEKNEGPNTFHMDWTAGSDEFYYCTAAIVSTENVRRVSGNLQEISGISNKMPVLRKSWDKLATNTTKNFWRDFSEFWSILGNYLWFFLKKVNENFQQKLPRPIIFKIGKRFNSGSCILSPTRLAFILGGQGRPPPDAVCPQTCPSKVRP